MERQEDIVPSDVLYEDEYVCILIPSIKKGVLVLTRFYVEEPTKD